MEALLEIRGLCKSFGHRQIIHDLSFEAYAGEVLGFLGPNGSGKTTTIKMVMGFLFPDKGDIIINHVNVKDNYEEAMKSIGGIVENPEMYKYLSGRTNLEMYARIHDGIDKNRIDEVIELVGMQNRANEKIGKFSLGMKQRIGVAQALIHKPKVLILDEPTNGLDPAGIKELRDILRKLAHEENVAVVVSSHMLSEMELMCDRVAIINNGKLLGIKSIEELREMGGNKTYRFSTKQAREAERLISLNYEGRISEVTDEYIDLAISDEEIGDINALFAYNGVIVTGINKNTESLEDAYMMITGGGNSIA